jgi:leader peptidase (prepilin peptidase) / N-methyltransferase
MSLSSLADVAAAFPWFFPAVFAVLGACVGSFLNVVIHRVPAGESIVRPGSHCACGAPIAWHDNLPVVSWFLRRGRARCCGRPFSFRYPFVELLTAALFLACGLLFPPAKAVIGMLFVSVLVAATFIDLDHFVIPDVFTLGAGGLGVVLSFAVPALHGHHGGLFIVDSLRSGVDALQGLLVGSGLVVWIALVAESLLKKEAMGFGDVKFVGMIGAFCGWQGAVASLFGGAVVGTVWFAVAFAWQKLSGTRAPLAPKAETPDGQPADLGLGVHVPFGPMLAIAGGLYFLFLHGPVDAWFAQIGDLL